MQVELDSKPLQTPLRCVAYAVQKPFKEKFEQLQKQDIITLLGMDEIVEWCNIFDETFSLQVELDSKPLRTPLRCVAYAVQKPFKEKYEQLQKQDIITLLGMDEIVEWCNSFVLVPKSSGKPSNVKSSVQKAREKRTHT